jgi:hypothetical protein
LDFEKYHAQKLRREPFATGEYVVTGTGNSSFRGMANDVIKAALGQKRKQFEEAVSTEERVWIFQHTIHRIIRELVSRANFRKLEGAISQQDVLERYRAFDGEKE